jgi:hypothetical protein
MTTTAQVAAGDWTEAEARRILDARWRSGLSIRAFALREGIRPPRVYWWIKRLE